MSNFKLKYLLKEKGIILTYLTLFSLFLCEKALAEWGKNCCYVNYLDSNRIIQENRIIIYFKFFEYSTIPTKKNSFLENFEVHYSADGGKTYIHLMSALTENQVRKNWAWITTKDKKNGERISLFTQPINKVKWFELKWRDASNPKLITSNHPKKQNESWLSVHWFPNENQNKITHIRIEALWNKSGTSPSEDLNIIYPIYYRSNEILKTNNKIFTKQEIRAEYTGQTH